MRRTRQSGFTLTELVVTIVVFAVLAVVSIPSFVELRERNSLRGAADNFAAAVGLAKQEAIKRGAMVRVEFHEVGDAVCAGAVVVEDDEDEGCDCSADACDVVAFPEEAGDIRPLRRVRLEGGVLFGDDGNGFVIDPRTGTLFDIGDTGGFTLATEAGYQVRLDVNAMARVQACVPAGAETLAGVPACD